MEAKTIDILQAAAVLDGSLRNHLGMPLHRCQMRTFAEQQSTELFYTLRDGDGGKSCATIKC